MVDVREVYVTLAQRSPKTKLFSAPDLRSALDRVRARPAPGASRFAIWTDAPAPDGQPDVVVCVPVPILETRRAQAEEVVARWDAMWLLVESMPHRHRDAARQHLVDEISVALLAAAIEGVEDTPVEDNEDVGF